MAQWSSPRFVEQQPATLRSSNNVLTIRQEPQRHRDDAHIGRFRRKCAAGGEQPQTKLGIHRVCGTRPFASPSSNPSPQTQRFDLVHAEMEPVYAGDEDPYLGATRRVSDF
ncbi:uncharacterized protein BO95DRAFT_466067 [Aspergillus brunneoviolaceus CBS 621.78]|uniref:Uncharacterized protein n=1 Tax=Aspergillus brunneoviolaceus CBS 621.78 TaxID=1450534 RepID=A0ACD1G221_9EURO|nr:hypothetical protein BO95DRAFT_466067 [Aspergillus brunneoviolaceus CBS 621.78]RAH43262.1 hypothetical protein BO95DRAFT_466067 [Aspergillus brunneoviolaceus CBS 621.78]